MRPFGCCNYTSFGDKGFWLSNTKKINIFIGKNNSGKSNVLKFIGLLSAYAKSGNSGFVDPSIRHWDLPAPALIRLGVTLGDLGLKLQGIPEHEARSVDLTDTYEIRYNPQRQEFVEPNPFHKNEIVYRYIRDSHGLNHDDSNYSHIFTQRHGRAFKQLISAQFNDVFFVPQFREFRYGDTSRGHDGKIYIDDDNVAGYRLAERMAWMKSPSVSFNLQKNKFQQIVDRVKALLDLPDLEVDFEDTSSDRPRAVILTISGLRRYLESFGSGVHQLVIMCFALSLKSNNLVCIEEPETFLHPGLQRKFLDFLRSTTNTYFITTHSNVLLDYAGHDDTTVYHVSHVNRVSCVSMVETTPDAYAVLDELQCHASDLMQANGIIWVEGPTDRLYLLRWLELMNSPYKEGVNFAIMFYGGKLLSHLGFSPDHITDHLLPMLRINRNAVVMLDSDRKGKYERLSKARKNIVTRLNDEMKTSKGWVWVTKGREVENYLSPGVLSRFANKMWPTKNRVKYDQYSSVDDMIKHGVTLRKSFKYSYDKVKHCREIVPLLENGDLSVLDLKPQLAKLIESINSWNPKIMEYVKE